MLAPGPLDALTLSETEPAQAGLETLHAMLNAGRPALLTALTINLSDPLFSNVLRLSLHKLACARALVPVALFLAGTLGPSWFAVLEAPQNAGYILTTSGKRQNAECFLMPLNASYPLIKKGTLLNKSQ
ncbi:hypothetical protein BC826DRAFT_1114019 [Russula brevipes]|nr:hypothetical protein BC826DRAFT_1114019 [Russula brevipes]